MIDLHTHSTASDGSFSPEQLVQEAHEINLKAIALTDHDVVSGVPDFLKAAQFYPDLQAIPGVELGVDHSANIEILALFIPNLLPFQQREKELLAIRNEANHKRLELFNQIGIPLSWEDVALDEKGQQRRLIGKPHFAEALLKKGFISSFREAFDKYMGDGRPIYVKKNDPSVEETITFIRENGAFPILAHPCHINYKGNDLFELIKDLQSKGLMGIEVYHSDHTIEQTKQYLEIAHTLHLLISGGSDFHGAPHPDVQLGIGKGNLSIPDDLLLQFQNT